MRKTKQKVVTGTALIPHVGDKGMKLSYKSPRIKLSIEIIGNILKYREFWKTKDGSWLFIRSKWSQATDTGYWIEYLEEYRELIKRDAEKGQSFLE